MKFLSWCLGVFVSAWAGQYVLAFFLPNIIMEALYQRGGDANSYNSMVVAPSPDETARSVVRPSPDLSYASCIYNLGAGPLRIEAPVPERYWSMQFYQMNTDNYGGITNQRDEQNRVGTIVNVTLIGPDSNPADYSGEVVQSPTQRGIVLLRSSNIGDDRESEDALVQSRCGPVVAG